MVRFRLLLSLTPGRISQYPLNRRLDKPQSHAGCGDEEKLPDTHTSN